MPQIPIKELTYVESNYGHELGILVRLDNGKRHAFRLSQQMTEDKLHIVRCIIQAINDIQNEKRPLPTTIGQQRFGQSPYQNSIWKSQFMTDTKHALEAAGLNKIFNLPDRDIVHYDGTSNQDTSRGVQTKKITEPKRRYSSYRLPKQRNRASINKLG